MPVIEVSAFQPFVSRPGVDTDLALPFACPPSAVACLNAAS
jgi:hypothetical protein